MIAAASEGLPGQEAARYSASEVLRNGARLEIRAQRPEDRAAMLAAFGRMGAQSRYYRFFSPKQNLSEAEIARFMNPDFVNHVALVAVAQHDGKQEIAGAARYVLTGPGTAEVAFGVDDPHQGLGIATALIKHLIAIARDAGLSAFGAEVLADNAPMLKVFEKCGLAMSTRREHGVVHAVLRLTT